MAKAKVPIKRLQLTDQGEILSLCSECVETGLLPDANLHMGYHEECEGDVLIRDVSKTSKVFYCNGCGLRVYFPRRIKSFSKLKDWLDKRLKIHVGGLALDT